MGRQQNLTRLALGRSAFQEAGSTSSVRSEGLHTNGVAEGDHGQQYDSKGRPFNPSTEAFNATSRNAQNEILSLTGIVERTDQSKNFDDLRRRYNAEQRHGMLAQEQDRGELLEYVLVPIKFLSHLWTASFIQKLQIGLYDPRLSIVEILIAEGRDMWKGGLAVSLATAFPALGDAVLHALVRLPLIIAVEQVTGRLQVAVHKGRLARKAKYRVYHAISVLFEVLLLGIDIALLPMDYYATTQRLGLAPSRPLSPPVEFFSPWNPVGFHSFAWQRFTSQILLKSLTSPAALLLLYKVFSSEDDDSEIPICSLLSSYRYPAINVDHNTTSFNLKRPYATDDPIGWVLDKIWLTRTKFLEWCGWNTSTRRTNSIGSDRPDPPAVVATTETYNDSNTIFPDYSRAMQNPTTSTPTPLPSRRSTSLAHLPTAILAAAVDNLFSTCLTLPFSSLMLRTIAQTYLSHSNPATQTPAARILAAAHRHQEHQHHQLYSPFGGGPLSHLLRSPTEVTAWSPVLAYVNRLGLALALQMAVDTVLFFGVYGVTRHIGTTSFAWGAVDDRMHDDGADDGDDSGTEAELEG